MSGTILKVDRFERSVRVGVERLGSRIKARGTVWDRHNDNQVRWGSAAHEVAAVSGRDASLTVLLLGFRTPITRHSEAAASRHRQDAARV